jgi:predicted MFS family arabinose efflux permease
VHWNADRVRLASCYAALGFGYIIPATFLPAMAHRYITDPAVFGWAWPVFGAAAALSTWAASRWLHAMDNRRLWAISYVLMAIGVVLPAVWPALASILVAALLVGGTFMVVTMLGLREARAVAGDQATGFIAAITAAFAVAQIIGPLVVSAVAHLRDGLAAALVAAALVLLVAAVSLWRSARDA